MIAEIENKQALKLPAIRLISTITKMVIFKRILEVIFSTSQTISLGSFRLFVFGAQFLHIRHILGFANVEFEVDTEWNEQSHRLESFPQNKHPRANLFQSSSK